MMNVSFYSRIILVFAALSLLCGLAILFSPYGNRLPGSGDNSAAITSAFALIVATLGLVLALYMQSAEYRRETEVVDGVQEIRLLLEVLIAQIAIAFAVQENLGSHSFEKQKELLLDATIRPAGRFLAYMSSTRSKETPEGEGQKWRLYHAHLARVFAAKSAVECIDDIVGLYRLLIEVTSADVRTLSKGFISVKSIDEMNTNEMNILVKVMLDRHSKNEEEKENRDPFETEGSLESAIAFLETNQEDGESLVTARGYYEAARAGDTRARLYIYAIHRSLISKDA